MTAWIADHGPSAGVVKSLFLCTLFQVGTIPEAGMNMVDQIMRSMDNDLNAIPGLNLLCGQEISWKNSFALDLCIVMT